MSKIKYQPITPNSKDLYSVAGLGRDTIRQIEEAQNYNTDQSRIDALEAFRHAVSTIHSKDEANKEKEKEQAKKLITAAKIIRKLIIEGGVFTIQVHEFASRTSYRIEKGQFGFYGKAGSTFLNLMREFIFNALILSDASEKEFFDAATEEAELFKNNKTHPSREKALATLKTSNQSQNAKEVASTALILIKTKDKSIFRKSRSTFLRILDDLISALGALLVKPKEIIHHRNLKILARRNLEIPNQRTLKKKKKNIKIFLIIFMAKMIIQLQKQNLRYIGQASFYR